MKKANIFWNWLLGSTLKRRIDKCKKEKFYVNNPFEIHMINCPGKRKTEFCRWIKLVKCNP